MVSYAEFAEAAPELAERYDKRVEPYGLVLVGTVRADGWPRISPVEPFVWEGQLYLGMMWQSRKALDLLRDPRVLVHTVVTDKDGTEGEVKLYGRAEDVPDGAEREAVFDAVHAATGFRPTGPAHLFRVAIGSAAAQWFGGGEQVVQRWRPGQPVTTERRQP